MKKMNILLISFLVLVIFSTSFVLAKTDNKNNLFFNKIYPFNEMIEKLTEILEQLRIIADKETNVEVVVEPEIIVEPAEVVVNVESGNEMAKRGNIILRESEATCTTDRCYFNVISSPMYVSLPQGNCSLTISTDCSGEWSGNIYSCEVRVAKDIGSIGTGFNCRNDCSGTVAIDEENFMIRIKPQSRASYTYMHLAYNCV